MTMVLATESHLGIMMPPRRNSFGGSDSEKIKSKSPPANNKSHWWFFTSKLKSADSVGGSNQHIATQKLRESKWFHDNEERLVCAVVECGFIVELKKQATLASQENHDSNNDDNNIESSNDATKSQYGIVALEMKKKDKKPTSSDLFVYTVTKIENKLKVVKLTIAELWKDGYVLRINNMNDKTKHINSEKEIKSQISYAIKHKTNFHNSMHFVDYCRYGPHLEQRKRQVSESVKWGALGVNAGMFLLRERSNSFSK